MPKSRNQKLKLLYLRDYLLKNSDEEHPVTVAQITEFLAKNDIEVERKTVYSDLALLKEYGMDIIMTRGKNVGYFVGNRDFQLPELKLLVDSVQSSKFITEKKTFSLIKRIEDLTSIYQAGSLQRQVLVNGRVKSMNESVYLNVDSISAAINNDKAISFRYYRYKLDKSREYRHDGMVYIISPFALIWDNENYYMLGYDNLSGKIKHFRVDKMTSIKISDESRSGKEEFGKTDLSAYTTGVFGMFGGKEEKITLRFDNSLIDAVIDRFGKDVMIIDEFSGTFLVTVSAQVSPQFFAWVFGFGNACEIVSPQSVRDELKQTALKVAGKY